jgi:hypothetical protein
MHTIKLTDEQMNVVGQALGELPFKVSAPIIQAINAQLQAASETMVDATKSDEAASE